MQCEYAYIKDGVRGLLCRKLADEPQHDDLKSVAHALCGNQRFCPTQRCFQMLPGWEKCPKRREKPVEAAGEKINSEAGKETPKKKAARKRSKEE